MKGGRRRIAIIGAGDKGTGNGGSSMDSVGIEGDESGTVILGA